MALGAAGSHVLKMVVVPRALIRRKHSDMSSGIMGPCS